MKYHLLAVLLVITSISFLKGQASYLPLIAEQETFQKRAMSVLGGWGAANVISGGIGMVTSNGAERSFHQMNLGWGIINSGLAVAGYLGARNMKISDPQGMNLLKKSLGRSKAFLFNAGLDVGYLGGGLYLRERAKNDIENRDRLHGFGNSVILQGAFLFTFDLIAYVLNDRITSKIQDRIISVGTRGSGVGLVIQL